MNLIDQIDKGIYQMRSDTHLENFSSRTKSAAKYKFWPHVYMALFAAGWVVTFDFGFRLYTAELVSVIGLVLIAWRTTLKQHPMALQIIGAYVLWIIATFVSDLINATNSFDMLRNIATPVIGGCSLIFVLAVLSRNLNALITFLAVTVVLKGIFGEPLYGDSFSDNALSWEGIQADTNFFKVRFEPFITPFLLLITCLFFRKSLKKSIIFFLVATVLYFFLDSRSIALVFLLTTIFLILAVLNYRPKFNQILKACIFAALIAYIAYLGYVVYTLTYNSEGHGGKQLLQLSNPYNPIELILVGRSEWLIILAAVYERPLFGWGSWAQDTTGSFGYLQELWLGHDIETTSIYIPVHSTLGSAWAWSGLLGLIAMLWLFLSILKMVIRLPNVKSKFFPVVAFFSILMIWHFFFSPPQSVRLFFPIALASLIVLTRNKNNAV